MIDLGAGPVLGDPDRLQQVVWNLLSNAIKFTPKGGRVQVRARARQLARRARRERHGRRASTPDFLPLVFERFRQADSSTTRTHGGLGLGLAIVRHLVELHGGTIEAQNRADGPGAVFSRGPARDGGPQARPGPGARQARGEQRRAVRRSAGSPWHQGARRRRRARCAASAQSRAGTVRGRGEDRRLGQRRAFPRWRNTGPTSSSPTSECPRTTATP